MTWLPVDRERHRFHSQSIISVQGSGFRVQFLTNEAREKSSLLISAVRSVPGQRDAQVDAAIGDRDEDISRCSVGVLQRHRDRHVEELAHLLDVKHDVARRRRGS